MSLYRNALFFLKGIHEFTREGYDVASASFMSKDLEVNVSGKSFMITGANSGIGKAAAIKIAKKGGTIHIVCRHRDRALEAKDEIVKLSGNENIFVHVLDISETKKVWQFAENFKKDHVTLDVLINNAGCMVRPRQVTKEGLELNFATNTLGTYVLTTCLLALLEKSEEPRVITVSSGGMLVQKLELGDLQCEKGPYDATMVYAQNKRQQVVMTEQWAKMKTNIHFSVMHPGWADTPAVRMAMPEFYRFMKTKLRSPEQGADTLVWLAVSKAAISHPSGLFFQAPKSKKRGSTEAGAAGAGEAPTTIANAAGSPHPTTLAGQPPTRQEIVAHLWRQRLETIQAKYQWLMVLEEEEAEIATSDPGPSSMPAPAS